MTSLAWLIPAALFLGLLGLIDAPRAEAAAAVATCQEAGIRVKMITGDHAGTALAIAISWSQHHSILWAIIHGVFSWLYVVYFALTRS